MATVLAMGVNYFYALALTHGLTSQEYGVFAAAQALLTMLGVAGSVAVPWVLAREIVRQKDDPVRRRDAVTFAFWVNIVAGAVLAVVMGSVCLTFAPLAAASMVSLTSFLLTVGSTAVGYLQGYRRNTALGNIILGEFVFKLGAGCLLVLGLGLGTVAALAAGTLGALVPLSACWFLRKDLGRPHAVVVDRDLWRSAGRIGGLQVLVAMIAATDQVLVAVLGSVHDEIGPYQVAAALGRIPLFLSVAVSIAVFPALAAGGQMLEQRVEGLRVYWLLGLLVVLALETVPDSVLELVFPNEFSSVKSVLPWTALIGFMLGWINMVTTFAQSKERTARATKGLGLGLLLHVLSCVVGTKVDGIHGLAVGAFIGTILALLALVIASGETKPVLIAINEMPNRYTIAGAVVLIPLAVTTNSPLVWLTTMTIGGLGVFAYAFRHVKVPTRQKAVKR